MDPASILGLVATCTSIIRISVGIISGLDELRERLRNVEVDARALRAQVESIREGTERMRTWLNNNTTLEESQIITLRESLDACEVTLKSLDNMIQKELATSGSASFGSKKVSLQKKLLHLWRESRIKRYREAVSHQLEALTFQFDALQLSDIQQRNARLGNPRARRLVERAMHTAMKIDKSSGSNLSSSTGTGASSDVPSVWDGASEGTGSVGTAATSVDDVADPLTTENLAKLTIASDPPSRVPNSAQNKGQPNVPALAGARRAMAYMAGLSRPHSPQKKINDIGSKSAEMIRPEASSQQYYEIPNDVSYQLPHSQAPTTSGGHGGSVGAASIRSSSRDTTIQSAAKGKSPLLRSEHPLQYYHHHWDVESTKSDSTILGERRDEPLSFPTATGGAGDPGDPGDDADDDLESTISSIESDVQSTIASLESSETSGVASSQGETNVQLLLYHLRSLVAAIQRVRGPQRREMSAHEIDVLRQTATQLQNEAKDLDLVGKTKIEKLVLALQNADETAARRLIIAERMNPNVICDALQQTPLHIAVQTFRPCPSIVRMLIEQGASRHNRNLARQTPMQAFLCRSSWSYAYESCVTLGILKTGLVNPTAAEVTRDYPRLTTLIERRAPLAIMEYLVSLGANIEGVGESGRTPVEQLCQSDNRYFPEEFIALEWLIGLGAHLNLFSYRNTALDWALLVLQQREESIYHLTTTNSFFGLDGSGLATEPSYYVSGVRKLWLVVDAITNSNATLLNLRPSSKTIISKCFLFDGIRDFPELPIQIARTKLRERVAMIALLPDMKLCSQIAEFHTAAARSRTAASRRV